MMNSILSWLLPEPPDVGSLWKHRGHDAHSNAVFVVRASTPNAVEYVMHVQRFDDFTPLASTVCSVRWFRVHFKPYKEHK